jgi:ElaB/YqjD/DUF883 family membrane-anchored ribosome-binding protein
MSILSHTSKTPPPSPPASQGTPLANQNKSHDASPDITQEFKNFVADVERLTKEAANLTGDDLARTKIKLNQRINSAKHYISSTSNTLAEQTQKAASITNEYVHEKPWAVIGTGAVVSFVLGMLLGQRNDDPPNK